MPIVTNRGPRRQRPKPAPGAIAGPRVVQLTPRGRAWRAKPLPEDPEADQRGAAFMQRMIRPR